MKLTKSTEYGIRALAILGGYYGKVDPPISIYQIISHDKIPIPFLEQILFRLRKKNLIVAKRGKLGGYWLTRSPEQITLAEVFAALDANFANSVTPETLETHHPKFRDFMLKYHQMAQEFLSKITVADLVPENFQPITERLGARKVGLAAEGATVASPASEMQTTPETPPPLESEPPSNLL